MKLQYLSSRSRLRNAATVRDQNRGRFPDGTPRNLRLAPGSGAPTAVNRNRP